MQDHENRQLAQGKITAKEIRERNTARGVGALIGGAIVLTGGVGTLVELSPGIISSGTNLLGRYILWVYRNQLQVMWMTEVAWGTLLNEPYTGPSSTGGANLGQGVRTVITGTLKRFKLNKLGFAMIEATKKNLEKLGVTNIRNIIFGQYTDELGDETINLVSHSGYPTVGGISAPQETGEGLKRLFVYTIEKAKNDSEVKIFEALARKMGATEAGQVFVNKKGTITITSQLKVCDSCEGIIKQFRTMFPNVNIRIIDSNARTMKEYDALRGTTYTK